MDGIWSLQSDAVVGTSIVIEENEALNLFQSLLLTLDNAVYTLCKGIVSRLIVLRHRYLYAVLLQFLHI